MYCDDSICSEWWNDSKTTNFPIMINIQLSCLSWNYCDKWLLPSLIRSGEESKMGTAPSSASSERSSQLDLWLLRRNLLPLWLSLYFSLLSCVQHLMCCVGWINLFEFIFPRFPNFWKTTKKTQKRSLSSEGPTFHVIKICLCLTSSGNHNFVLPFVLELRKHNEALTMALCPCTVVCEDFFLKQMFLQGLNKDLCTLKAQ